MRFYGSVKLQSELEYRSIGPIRGSLAVVGIPLFSLAVFVLLGFPCPGDLNPLNGLANDLTGYILPKRLGLDTTITSFQLNNQILRQIISISMYIFQL